jgi:hypothetical protein
LAAASAPLGMLRVELLTLPAVALVAVVALNRSLYSFFRQQGGSRLAAVSIALHLLYYFYSSVAYLYAWLEHGIGHAALAVQKTQRTSTP